ncbi:hypothetical protein [Roseovarius sp. SYSU LYC5161]|uniref:hypothetical protein n=1 Tax=Roseovarius halophilus (ex Wu et al. 2025) TaxID=3376060 RepID=UPI00399AA84D
MPLPTTGPISLADIATEFGGNPPHSISEYYGAAAGVPASGAVGIGAFRSKSAITTFFATITTSQWELNLYNYLTSQGWDSSSEVEVTVANGVYIWSDNTSVAALKTGGPYPSGLTLINEGFIMGKGGDGGYQLADRNGYVAPTTGGPAVELDGPITIDNSSGYIGGGGGGGAAQTGIPVAITNTAVHSPGGGGAGGGRGGPMPHGNTDSLVLGGFGPGGAIGQPGSVATNANNWVGATLPSHGGAGGASGAGAQEGGGI